LYDNYMHGNLPYGKYRKYSKPDTDAAHVADVGMAYNTTL